MIAAHVVTFLAGFGVGVLVCWLIWLRYVLDRAGGRWP